MTLTLPRLWVVTVWLSGMSFGQTVNVFGLVPAGGKDATLLI